MARKYKLYLFDLDGTLLDSDQLLIEVFHKFYSLYKPADFKVDDANILTFSGPQITETLKKEFPEMDQDFMLGEWKKYSSEYTIKCIKLFEGADNLLRLMSEKKIKFGIVTNKHKSATEFTLKVLKIDDLNIYCVCADDVKNLKPNPEGIYKAMEYFDVPNKEDVIYIGDSIYDYLTAKNAGVNFGLVSWSTRELPKDAKVDLLIEKYETFAKDFEWKTLKL